MADRIVSVFGSSTTQPGEEGYRQAEQLGRMLVEAGFAVANGGYGGTMEAVSAGARAAGGRVIGHTAPTVFPDRSTPNPHLTVEMPAPTLTQRIHALLADAVAAVALPGSIGTFTELMVAWNLNFVAPFGGRVPRPLVAVGPLWQEVVPYLTERLAAPPDLVRCLPTPEAAVDHIRRVLGHT